MPRVNPNVARDRLNTANAALKAEDHHAAAVQAGLDPARIQKLVQFFTSSILPFLGFIIPLLKTNNPPTEVTDAHVSDFRKLGVEKQQLAIFSAAGIDIGALLQWFQSFVSSGKIPQLIQLVMELITVFKPNIPIPAPVMQSSGPGEDDEDEEEDGE